MWSLMLMHINSSSQNSQSFVFHDSMLLKIDIDVFKIQYEFNISCLLNQIWIIMCIKYFILSEFKLQSFLANIIKIIIQCTDKEQRTVLWDYEKTELKHKDFKKIIDYSKNDVFDHDDWKKMEKTLKTWMKKKALNIRVNLSFNFKIIEKKIQSIQNTCENVSSIHQWSHSWFN